ncbi:aspartic peptidase domain-containing protein [Podospora australis]|uniref:Aspartic peptidase domain-containing protein n=1 Tax=Podospora australis TaxID=1536484 RepID=A0AAN7AH77_9PEZI|nr:aspartic peptidase domain-containing protein [Podospora australis]
MYGRYPDGQYIAGPFGFSDITVANLTVAKQQVCLANETFWLGNNFTSGHLGMAYPALTNSYTGDQDLQHLPISQVKYSPFFTTLVQEGTIDASFCLALDRNETTGIFALGGDVDVPGLDPDPSNTVALDMIIANLQGDANPQASYQYSFYTVIPDGWVYDQTNTTRKMPYIIDSGTTCNYLPPNIANDINSRFDPPGSYLSGYGAYYTECDAIPPSVAVVLDGVEFEISAEDMVLQHVRDESTDLCMTAIGNGGDGPYILGDGFLRNALVTMDIGQAKVWFTPRRY